MDIDRAVEQKQKGFDLLERITDLQLEIHDNIGRARNVTDWPLYLNKCQLRLKALNDARQTITSLIDRIDKKTDLQAQLDKIEAMLESDTNET